MKKSFYNQIRDQEFIFSIDRHFAEFCQRLHGTESDLLKTAALLCSNRIFRGDIFLDLETIEDLNNLYNDEDFDEITVPSKDNWLQDLQLSPVVGSPEEKKPLILSEDGHLYLYRYWNYEKKIYSLISQLSQRIFDFNKDLARKKISQLFDLNEDETNLQALAAHMSLQRGLTVISGGPGTGKTTTAVKILILLIEELEDRGMEPRIELCAPTGKAAARLTESIIDGKRTINYDSSIVDYIPDAASTIHRLLGSGNLNTVFRYNDENPLDCNILLVDETSMVESSLMAHLLSAVFSDCRVIMLGDMHQLTSVGAGSVFSDICNRGRELNYSPDFKINNSWLIKKDMILKNEKNEKYGDFILKLQKSYRFDHESGIGKISKAILQGDTENVMSILKNPAYEDVVFLPMNESGAKKSLKDLFLSNIHQSENKDYDIKSSVMLTPVKKGPWGTEALNKLIIDEEKQRPLVASPIPLFEGMPVIINSNNYTFDLYNGDIGIVHNIDGMAAAYFSQNDRHVDFSNLSDYSHAYGLTIHRSQGSEYNSVFLVMPRCRDSLLTRELLYTAITRARKRVYILSEEKIIRHTVENIQKRRSSLGRALWL
jgi:exodeoxyribonuclease V alpha subunit